MNLLPIAIMYAAAWVSVSTLARADLLPRWRTLKQVREMHNRKACRTTFGCSFAVAASSSIEVKRPLVGSASQAWARTTAFSNF